jgi:hypothetical protein
MGAYMADYPELLRPPAVEVAGNEMGVIRECALLPMVVTVWAEPALARNYLNCLTKK